MKRRGFLKTFFGGVIGASPIVAVAAKLVQPDVAVIKEFDLTMISIIRKTLPENLATQLIAVQPMTDLSGNIFSLRYEPETEWDGQLDSWGSYIV